MFDKRAFEDLGFSWQAALNLVLVSRQAYNDDNEIRAEAERWGFTRFRFFNSDDTQGFAAADAENVLIGFRGTEGNFADWFGNLRVAPKDTGRNGYGTVHTGFYSGYHDVHDALLEFLEQVGAATKKLWIAGHSLGGALSIIAAAELHAKRFEIAAIHTVGQPRTGTTSFLDFCDSVFGDRYARIVNNRDIVPRVPPGYGHTGMLYWFDKDGDLKQSGRTRSIAGDALPSPEPEPLSDTEFEALDRQLHENEEAKTQTRGSFGSLISRAIPGVADHDLDAYTRLIKAQVDIGTDLL
jgi:hypothetical protein